MPENGSLSRSSTITLGLAIVLLGAVYWISASVSGFSAKIDGLSDGFQKIDSDLSSFRQEFRSYQTRTEGQTLQFARDIAELRTRLAALEKGK